MEARILLGMQANVNRLQAGKKNLKCTQLMRTHGVVGWNTKVFVGCATMRQLVPTVEAQKRGFHKSSDQWYSDNNSILF